MTPAEFVKKWSDSELRERQGAQEHFIDLCRLLGEPTPAEDDPKGKRYCFERGAEKVGGGDGWADAWRRGCFRPAGDRRQRGKGSGKDYRSRLVPLPETIYQDHMEAVSGATRCQNTKF